MIIRASSLFKFAAIGTPGNGIINFIDNCVSASAWYIMLGGGRLCGMAKTSPVQRNLALIQKSRQTLMRQIKLTPFIGHRNASQRKPSSKTSPFNVPPKHLCMLAVRECHVTHLDDAFINRAGFERSPITWLLSCIPELILLSLLLCLVQCVSLVWDFANISFLTRFL